MSWTLESTNINSFSGTPTNWGTTVKHWESYSNMQESTDLSGFTKEDSVINLFEMTANIGGHTFTTMVSPRWGWFLPVFELTNWEDIQFTWTSFLNQVEELNLAPITLESTSHTDWDFANTYWENNNTTWESDLFTDESKGLNPVQFYFNQIQEYFNTLDKYFSSEGGAFNQELTAHNKDAIWHLSSLLFNSNRESWDAFHTWGAEPILPGTLGNVLLLETGLIWEDTDEVWNDGKSWIAGNIWGSFESYVESSTLSSFNLESKTLLNFSTYSSNWEQVNLIWDVNSSEVE